MLVWIVFYAGFNLAPQTEHFPSAVIFGCSATSFPHTPHFIFRREGSSDDEIKRFTQLKFFNYDYVTHSNEPIITYFYSGYREFSAFSLIFYVQPFVRLPYKLAHKHAHGIIHPTRFSRPSSLHKLNTLHPSRNGNIKINPPKKKEVLRPANSVVIPLRTGPGIRATLPTD